MQDSLSCGMRAVERTDRAKPKHHVTRSKPGSMRRRRIRHLIDERNRSLLGPVRLFVLGHGRGGSVLLAGRESGLFVRWNRGMGGKLEGVEGVELLLDLLHQGLVIVLQAFPQRTHTRHIGQNS